MHGEFEKILEELTPNDLFCLRNRVYLSRSGLVLNGLVRYDEYEYDYDGRWVLTAKGELLRAYLINGAKPVNDVTICEED